MPQDSSIIFRRWSRKSYAVFAGLGRHIIIGVLSIGICIMAMLKTGVVASDNNQQIVSKMSLDDSEEESIWLSSEGLLCLVVSNDKGESACATSFYNKIAKGCVLSDASLFSLYEITINSNECSTT